jgi:hypothetical protein
MLSKLRWLVWLLLAVLAITPIAALYILFGAGYLQFPWLLGAVVAWLLILYGLLRTI